MVVDKVISGLVEHGSSVLLSDSQTDGIGETLTEGSGSDLNTWSVVGLRMAGCDAVDLLQAVSVPDLGGEKSEHEVDSLGRPSGRQCSRHIRKDGGEHIGACIRDRSCAWRVSPILCCHDNVTSITAELRGNAK